MAGMPETLSPQEIRVLGCLMEKERLTPEVYPMTVNGLITACNQKTSREPVVEYDEEGVGAALEALQGRRLASWIHQAGARARKFRHHADTKWKLNRAEMAVLCLLMLRGPQTAGELRSRSDRLHGFESLEEVQEVLGSLAELEEPLVAEAPRGPGQKETRFAHLLGGPVETWAGSPVGGGERLSGSGGGPLGGSPAPSLPAVWEARVEEMTAGLRREVEQLRGEVRDLQAQFKAFKQQFE